MQYTSETITPSDLGSKSRIDWPKVIMYCVMLCAAVPKIIIGEGTNIYLPEIILMISLFLFGIKQFIIFPEQRFLIGIFGTILLFSILAQNSVNDTGAILRCVKQILYIPIIYWASIIKNPSFFLKQLIMFGILALIINIVFYKLNFSSSNTIWSGAETISSGMSNRGINLTNFKIEQLPGLAHGIWGTYCDLIFIISLILYNKKIIGVIRLGVVTILFAINATISISRESILILTVVLFLYLVMPQRKLLYKILIIILVSIVMLVIIYYGSQLPIVQKINYTIDNLSSSGTEGGIQARLNTWEAYYNFLAKNFSYVILGLGLSPENFYLHVHKYTSKQIVSVPESAIVYVQAYGGVIASGFLQLLIFTGVRKVNKNTPHKLLKYFFIGILITNAVSGVSMFSDMLYAHLCMIYGLLILNKN